MPFTVEQLTLLSLVLLAIGLLLAAVLLLRHDQKRTRTARVVGRAISHGYSVNVAPPPGGKVVPGKAGEDAAGDFTPGTSQDKDLPAHWLQSRLGKLLVADEDRKLIDQCGFPSVRAQLNLLVLRLGTAVMLPALVYALQKTGVIQQQSLFLEAVAFVAGFLLPKWLLSRYAAARRERVAHELPLFVDLLRLLQGVGLSLDQSLQVMATDFTQVLQVLGGELVIANRQYAQGRPREHSLQRLATLHNNDSLAGLVALLVQVDRHGGAVQEPLRQFGDRLREHRRAELKERIGKITVKMTGVMVTTLLPALIIVTAGPGFLAVIRALGAMGK